MGRQRLPITGERDGEGWRGRKGRKGREGLEGRGSGTVWVCKERKREREHQAIPATDQHTTLHTP